jgi:N-glycosylase/DNA lyase
MQLSQINNAIAGLCQDVEDAIKSRAWSDMTERELIHELVLCILGSGVRYEIAASYSVAISKNGCLLKKYLKEPDYIKNSVLLILNNEVASLWDDRRYKRYRYPNIRATYIAESYCNIVNEFDSLKSFLSKSGPATKLRRELVRICPGIGPKQASHFLKNVGYSDELAIIDRHIIKYMEMTDNNININSQLGRLDKYEHVESIYINAISKFKFPVAIVDQAMWFVMRELGKEAMI